MAATAAEQLPRDDALPQLRDLLDSAAMAPVLARSLAGGEHVAGVRIVYLRYKPATRLTVRYSARVGDALHDATALAEPAADLAGWAADARHLALARKVDGRAPTPTPLTYDPEVAALIQWLPLDISMPALASDPDELRGLLRQGGVDIDGTGDGPTLLAYKARRRAVLRLDDHVVKIYAGLPEFENAVVGLESSGRLSEPAVPARELVRSDLRLTCQTLLPGRPPSGHHAAARAAGSALARVHRGATTGLRSSPVERQLAAAAASARSASAVVPELAQRLTALVAALERTLPDAGDLVAAHGDFHANQVLELDGGLAVIDFDEICAAPAALDFSSYVAHLVTGASGDLAAAAGALDDLVTGYGARPAGLAWFVSSSILRRAPFPFRFMESRWPARIEQMVEDAEEALRL